MSVRPRWTSLAQSTRPTNVAFVFQHAAIQKSKTQFIHLAPSTPHFFDASNSLAVYHKSPDYNPQANKVRKAQAAWLAARANNEPLSDFPVITGFEKEGPVRSWIINWKNRTLNTGVALKILNNAREDHDPNSNLGEIAMNYFWDKYQDYRYPEDDALVLAIVHLLVLEGEEEMVWKWIGERPIDHVSAAPTNLRLPHIRLAWRASALRALIEVKAFHLPPEGVLDDALEAYFRAKSLPYHVPMVASKNLCLKLLTRRDPFDRATTEGGALQKYDDTYESLISGTYAWRTNPKLWQAFYKDIKDSTSPGAPRELALLSLFNPRKPNPVPLFRVFTKLAYGDYDPNFNHEAMNDEQKAAWYRRLLETRTVLLYQNKGRQAKLLEDVYDKLFKTESRRPPWIAAAASKNAERDSNELRRLGKELEARREAGRKQRRQQQQPGAQGLIRAVPVLKERAEYR